MHVIWRLTRTTAIDDTGFFLGEHARRKKNDAPLLPPAIQNFVSNSAPLPAAADPCLACKCCRRDAGLPKPFLLGHRGHLSSAWFGPRVWTVAIDTISCNRQDLSLSLVNSKQNKREQTVSQVSLAMLSFPGVIGFCEMSCHFLAYEMPCHFLPRREAGSPNGN